MLQDPATWACGVHGAITIWLYSTALPRYGEEAEVANLQDTDSLLARILRRVSSRLEERITPLFQRKFRNDLVVLPQETPTYSSEPVEVIGSEGFRDTVHDFVAEGVEPMQDYLLLSGIRKRQLGWVKFRRWAIFSMTVWETACTAALGLYGVLLGNAISEKILAWSFAPSGVVVLCFLVSWAYIRRQQEKIDDRRSRYPEI